MDEDDIASEETSEGLFMQNTGYRARHLHRNVRLPGAPIRQRLNDGSRDGQVVLTSLAPTPNKIIIDLKYDQRESGTWGASTVVGRGPPLHVSMLPNDTYGVLIRTTKNTAHIKTFQGDNPAQLCSWN